MIRRGFGTQARGAHCSGLLWATGGLLRTTVDSKMLEYGFRVLFAGFPSFCFGIRGRPHSNFLASTGLYHTILYHTILYHIILYHIIMHHTVTFFGL